MEVNEQNDLRKRLRIALDKPLPDDENDIGCHTFDPWEDVISGIYGGYSSESDDLMMSVLQSVWDGTTFDLIKSRGFVAEFALYVLAGHGLTEYGTSPRGGWPDPSVEDMWQELIDKWGGYMKAVWRGT